MLPWRTPERGAEFTIKFLRLGERIFVGTSMQDGHADIALMDGIDKAIDVARVRDNLSVDGGLVGVKGGDIYVGGNSNSLQLPVLGKEASARAITLEVFKDQNPSHSVIECNKSS